MNMTDYSSTFKHFRASLFLLCSCCLPSLAFAATAPSAVNDDLRTTDPVAANATLTIDESDLIGNDAGDGKAVKAVSAASSGATVSWSDTNSQVTYTPGNGTANKFLALDSGEHSDEIFTYTLEGTGGADDTATVQVRVTGVNNSPTLTGMTGTLPINDNVTTATPLSGATIGDVDVENVTVTITVATNRGSFSNAVAQGFAASTSSGNNVYTYTGSTSNAQTKTRALKFTPKKNLAQVGQFTAASISVKVSDGDLNFTESKTVSLESINDVPSFTLPATNPSMDDDKTLAIFAGTPGVTLVDPDLADSQDVVITYDIRKGTFPDSAQYVKSGTNANSKLTISNATVTSANTIIRGLILTPVPNQVAVGASETLSFSLKSTDEKPSVGTATLSVSVISVNEPPVVLENGGSTGFTVTAGGTVTPYTVVNIEDPDVESSGTGEGAGDSFKATIVLNRATGIDLGSIGSSAFILKAGTADTYEYSNAIGVIQDAVRALNYSAPADAAIVTLTLSVSDVQGTSSNDLVVTVTSTIPNPGISGLQAGQEVFDNSSLIPFSTALFSNVGVGDRIVEISLDSDVKGTFDILGPFQYLSGGGLPNPVYRMTGNAVEANEALRNVRFNPTENLITGGSDTVQFTIQMFTSVGSAALSTDNLTITVKPVNDAPSISSDSPTYRITDDDTENPYRSLLVSDPDEVGGQIVTITLSLSGSAPAPAIANQAGTLTLNTLDEGYNLKDFAGSIVFDASQFTYTATPTPTITIGNIEFAYNDTTKKITFDKFTTAPLDLEGNAYAGQELIDYTAKFAALSLTFDRDFDPDEDPNNNNNIAFLSFYLSTGTSDAKSGLIAEIAEFEFSQFIGEPSELNELLDVVLFTPTQNRNQDGERETITFTLLVTDGNGGAAQVSDVLIVVQAVDGAPLIHGVPALSQQPAPIPGTENTTTNIVESNPFSEISITDDDGPGTVTVEIALDDFEKGTLSGGGFTETGTDTGVYTKTDTLMNMNAALVALQYDLSTTYDFPVNAPGETEFTITAIDASTAANRAIEVYGVVVREPIASQVVTQSTDYDSSATAIAGSLRKAIADANSGDFIVFDFASDAYPVTIRLEETLNINKNLTIVGARPESLTISGDTDDDGALNNVQLFTVTDGATLTIEQLTLKHGKADAYGGAISVGEDSMLKARYISFEENEAGQFGGAVDVDLGQLMIQQCLFLNNKVDGSIAIGGGAVAMYTPLDCSITNSTFVGNQQLGSGGEGGGSIYAHVGNDQTETLELMVENCTFYNNIDVKTSGSAILSSTGTDVILRNNIFADDLEVVVVEGESPPAPTVLLDRVGDGSYTSLGGNLATDDTSTTYATAGDITILNHEDDLISVTELDLIALADNGGPTLTCGLGATSVAKNFAVSPSVTADTLMTDQRGVWRGSPRSSGAYQYDEFKRININEIYFETGAQFIEFYNPRESEALDMQATQLYVDGTLIHTFTASLPVQSGAGFALDQADWLAGFELNAEAGNIVLKTASDQILLEVNYVANFVFGEPVPARLEVDGQSIVRYPNFEGAFLPHRRVVERATGSVVTTGKLSSKNEDVNGAPLSGGNAPPIAVADDAGYSLYADETLSLDVLTNDIEFDRIDVLKIKEVMPFSGGSIINSELNGLDAGTGTGSIAFTGLNLDTTADSTGVTVTIHDEESALMYDPVTSSAMIGLAQGEQVVDVWGYTILDYHPVDVAHDRDPRGDDDVAAGTTADDLKRIENLKAATSYVYVTVTGVNETPEAGNDGVDDAGTPAIETLATFENQAVRLLANNNLVGAGFDFEDQDADYMDFNAVGGSVVLKPTLYGFGLLDNDEDVDSDDTNQTIELINVHQTVNRDGLEDQVTTTSLLGATVTLDIRSNRQETHVIYDPRSSPILNALSATDSAVEDSFYYTVVDRHGAWASAKVTIMVSGVNDIPTANDDADFFSSEDSTLQIHEDELLANDTDPDQDGQDQNDVPDISSVPATTVLGADLQFDGSTITYDPTGLTFYESMARNEIVIDQFTYEITDGTSGSTSEATVYIEFVGVNDAPVAADDALDIDENDSQTVAALGLLADDVDVDVNGTTPDDDIWVLPQREVTTPLGAALNIETDGSFSYDANSALIESMYAGEQIVEVFEYTVTDNSRTSAVDDTFKIVSNRTDVVLPVLVNDLVAGSLRTSVVGYTDGGDSVVIESDNHGLRDGLLIQVENYDGASDYNGVYAVAVIDRDHFSVPLAFVDDPDGTRGTWRPWFNITQIGNPDSEGKVEIGEDAQTLIYTPKVNFYGTEILKYTIEDGAGGQDVAAVEMLVIQAPFNSFLVAKDDEFDVYANQTALVVDVLANDNVLPALGSDLIITDVVAVGSASGEIAIVNGGKSLSYEPDALLTHRFTYTVTGDGSSSTQAIVSFNVKLVEDFLPDSDAIETALPSSLTDIFVDPGENYVVVKNSTDNRFAVLANDVALPNSPVSLDLLEITQAASHGQAQVVLNEVSYQPTDDYTGADSFTYTVRDELGNEQVKVVDIRVVEDDADEFYAVEDHYVIWAGSESVSLPVLGNDIATGVNSDALHITNLGLDAQAPLEAGRVSVTDSAIIYTAPDAATTEAFTYEIRKGDDTNERREGAIVITVLDAYPELNPLDDLFAVAKNSSGHSLDVLLNDSAYPVVGWTRTITGVGSTDNGGTVSINSGATLDYSPAADFYGIETVTYTVTDTFGETESADVTVMVGMQITGDDAFTVLHGSQDHLFPVLVNDDLLDRYAGDYVIHTVGGADQGGSVVIEEIETEVEGGENEIDYQLRYSPAPTFVGTETFTYTVIDQSDIEIPAKVVVQVLPKTTDRDSAFLSVTITGVNDAPVLVGTEDDEITDKESSFLFDTETFKLSDVDEAGDQEQTVTVNFDAAHGKLYSENILLSTPGGKYEIVGTPAEVVTALRLIEFRPFENLIPFLNPGYFDSVFTLTIYDGYISPVITDLTTIRVNAVNDAPNTSPDISSDVANDAYGTFENQAIRMVVDGTLLSTAFDFGDLTPDWQEVDAMGDPVTLLPELRTPHLLDNDFDVDIDNDTDPLDGGLVDDIPTIEIINIHETSDRVDQIATTSALGATVVLDIRAARAESSIVYDPRSSAILNALSAGETIVDTFYYTVIDQHDAEDQVLVSITVTGVNDVPTANDDGQYDAEEDQTLVILGSGVLSNDTDPDQDTSDPDDAPIISNVPATSDLGANLSFDGTDITYDPTGVGVFEALARNEFITDSITYTISDENGGTSQATIALEIEGYNDAPIAADDLLKTLENVRNVIVAGPRDTDGQYTAGLLSNDTEIDFDNSTPDDDHWVIPQREVTTDLGAAFYIETDGSYSYDANSRWIDSLIEGEPAVEVFPYIVIDNFRTSTAPDTFKVLTDSTNVTLPVLSNDDVAGSVPVAVLGYAEDAGDANRVIIESTNHELRDGLLIKIQSYAGSGAYNGVFPITVEDRNHFSIESPYRDDASATRGTWRPWFNITALGETDQEGVVTIAADAQTILYTPKAGFYGSESFQYTIEDGVGGQDVTLVEMTVLQDPLNNVLSASDDRFQIGMSESDVEVDVLVNDNILPESGYAYTITDVSAGSASGALSIVSGGTALSYTPISPAFSGDETFTYTISGGGSSNAQATVTFVVIDREGYLDGSDDDFVVVQDSSGNLLDVAVNDASRPSFPVSFEVVAVSTPSAGGAVSIVDGQVSYTPAASYTGVDSFTYTIRDASGANATKAVDVQVVPAADDFYAADDHYIIVAGSGEYDLSVMFNDTSIGSVGPLSIINLGLDTQAPPEVSRVEIDDGVVKYTVPSVVPAGNIEVFNYEITDGTDQRREAVITVTIVDQLPTLPNALDDDYHVAKDSSGHSLDVMLNDSPLPSAGWAWTITGVTAASQGGSVAINGGTDLTYSPAVGFYGVESFDYTIEDVFGDTSTATVTVEVGMQLTEPDHYVVLQNSSANDFTVLLNDDILERFPADYTISAVSDPDQSGEVTLDGSGPNNQLLYTPVEDFVGLETFTYTVIDKTGATLVETVTVEVFDEDDGRDSAILRVEITGVNDTPQLSGVADGATTDKLSVKPFPSVLITDLDEWAGDLAKWDGEQAQNITVEYDEAYGTLFTPGMTRTSTGVYQMTGTPAEVTIALNAIVFTPYENFIDYIDPSFYALDFDLSIDDTYLLGQVSDTATIVITPINDAPTLVSEYSDWVLPVNSAPRARLLTPNFADVDDDIAASELIWTVSSDNPSLFNSITVDATKQLLVVDFAADQFGVAVVTVRATDRGGLFVETSFQVTIVGPPVIELEPGETQPPAPHYVLGSRNGFRRDYTQSFRVINEGSLTADAFIVHVSDLNVPVDGITLIAGKYSTDENATLTNFNDDTIGSQGVTILQQSTYVYTVKYDVPIFPGESVVVHLTYQVASIDPVVIRPTTEIELTTASPTGESGMVIDTMLDGVTGEVKLTFNVEAGHSYRLEYSSDLSAWTPWQTPIPEGDFDRQIQVIDDGLNTDIHPSLVQQRFYRLIDTTVL